MKKIFINYTSWQTRCAVTKDELLQNIYYESSSNKALERCFFRGTISKILPGIQTAFVEIKQEKAGFLHISEVDRELAISKFSDSVIIDEETGEEKPQKLSHSKMRQAMDMAKIFKEGEPVLVQVCKEPVYEKGAKLTTCYTLPGRFVVLMPNIAKIVISKKIEDRDERIRLKEIVKKALPEGMGAIIRTSSKDRTEREISKDISVLVQTWNSILSKFNKAKNEELIHEDLPMYLQVIRDHLDNDVEVVATDSRDIQSKIIKFIKAIAPEFANSVKFYEGPPSLFEYFNIEKQIESALNKKVNLKSGGSIIIETTESMTAIDVNTGRFIGKGNHEETIFKTNIEAAYEVARQLRLRNIGGIIVIDFIDMGPSGNKQKLYKTLEQHLKETDKFQSVVLQISEFGLVQMTRKRSGKTLQQQLCQTCGTCSGNGYIKSLSTIGFFVLRNLKNELKAFKTLQHVVFSVNPQMFEFITHQEYNAILNLEKEFNCRITLISNDKIELSGCKVESIQA